MNKVVYIKKATNNKYIIIKRKRKRWYISIGHIMCPCLSSCLLCLYYWINLLCWVIQWQTDKNISLSKTEWTPGIPIVGRFIFQSTSRVKVASYGIVWTRLFALYLFNKVGYGWKPSHVFVKCKRDTSHDYSYYDTLARSITETLRVTARWTLVNAGMC